MAAGLRSRSPREVLEDHLRLRAEGDLDADLERNVSPEIVVLTCTGVWRGHDGVRRQANALERYTDPEDFEYSSVVVDGELGYLEWSATDGNGGGVRHGADSYVIRDGRIVGQTIHYVVRDGA